MRVWGGEGLGFEGSARRPGVSCLGSRLASLKLACFEAGVLCMHSAEGACGAYD